MARKKIREYDAKRLFWKHFAAMWKGPGAPPAMSSVADRSLTISSGTNFRELKHAHPWLLNTKLVVKPDILIGQRGKHDLVKLNCTIAEAEQFVDTRLNQWITVNGTSGPVTHFLLEPFIPHNVEYYVSIVPSRLCNTIHFSAYGGVEVESNWDKMLELELGVSESIETAEMGHFREQVLQRGHVTPEDAERVLEFVRTLYRIFMALDFAMIEINPFTFATTDNGTELVPLDFVSELDDTAHFKNRNKWVDGIEFPQPFGAVLSPEEKFVQSLDAKTGASLKLTVLKPTGRIWNLVAGGGASVIFADTVCDFGFAHELANYGEYSGAPNEEETYQYAKTVIDLATRRPDDHSRALLIGGGIANFTDVAKTFKGIIHALREYAQELVRAHMRIYVRRAGPNYEVGLKLMRQVAAEIGVPIEVYGPETQMTFIVARAIDDLKADGSIHALTDDQLPSSSVIPAKRHRE